MNMVALIAISAVNILLIISIVAFLIIKKPKYDDGKIKKVLNMKMIKSIFHIGSKKEPQPQPQQNEVKKLIRREKNEELRESSIDTELVLEERKRKEESERLLKEEESKRLLKENEERKRKEESERLLKEEEERKHKEESERLIKEEEERRNKEESERLLKEEEERKHKEESERLIKEEEERRNKKESERLLKEEEERKHKEESERLIKEEEERRNKEETEHLLKEEEEHKHKEETERLLKEEEERKYKEEAERLLKEEEERKRKMIEFKRLQEEHVRREEEENLRWEVESVQSQEEQSNSVEEIISQDNAIAVPRFLVVDDAKFLRTMLRRILEEAGYEVVGEAENGKEAVRLTEKLQPNVITMDITMPDMDGIAATDLILKKFPKTKVIMCSASDQAEKVAEAFRVGASDFISKPFEKLRALEIIKKVLES